MEIAEKLKRLRCKMNLTQKEVAEILGITRTVYANYEQGFREPDLLTLWKIADFFDVSVDYLLGRKDV